MRKSSKFSHLRRLNKKIFWIFYLKDYLSIIKIVSNKVVDRLID